MNKITISGIIGWDVYPSDVRLLVDTFDGDIEVEVSSPGGFVYDGIEIFNIINSYNRGRKTCMITGLAASMASYIVLACDEVKAYDNAVYMIHNASGIVAGDQNEIRKYASVLEGLSEILSNKYVQKTGKSKNEIKAWMDEETYFFGREMLEAGFIDEIITSGKESGNRENAVEACVKTITACNRQVKRIGMGDVDIDKVAAYLDEEKIKNTQAKNIKKEDIKMETLEDFLKKNPEALVQHNKIVEEARESGGMEIMARVNFAKGFLSNDNYPKNVGELAVKVISGETKQEVLETVIASIDAMKASGQLAEAQRETGELGETPAETQTSAQMAQASFEERKKRINL